MRQFVFTCSSIIGIFIVLHLLIIPSFAGRDRSRRRGLKGRSRNRGNCPPGFRQRNGGCVEVNECTSDNAYGAPSQCGQLCVNTLGSYRCSCLQGYSIGADDWSCFSGGPEPNLIFSNRNGISEVGVRDVTRQGSKVDETRSTVLSLAVHYSKKLLVWIDRTNNRIVSKSLDGGETRQVVWNSLPSPEALSVDWVQDKIYWTDSRLKTIERCSINGTKREMVFYTGKRKPRVIAIDPFEEYIFWTATGKQDKIERVAINGRKQKRVAKNNIRLIKSMAVDIVDKHLYWLDSGRRKIESANYDGKRRRTIVGNVGPNAYGLAVFEQKIYWTDAVKNTIHSIIKYKGIKSRIHWSVYVENSPRALAISHPSLQPMEDPTVYSNCTTSSDCAMEVSNAEPDTSQPYLVYANTTSIHRINTDGSSYATIASAGLRNISAVEYDLLENKVYYADVKRRVIERVGTDGRGLEVVAERGVSLVEGMAIDWMHRRLYWVDSIENHITIQSLYPGSRHSVLLADLEEPRGITVHPALNIIYWSSWGESPKIEAARHDGSNRVTVAASPVRPTKLTIDYTQNKVLWIDAGPGTINEANLDGTNHRIINKAGAELHHPFGLSLFQDLIWTVDSDQVLALDRTNGEKMIAFSGDWIRPVDVHLIHSGTRIIGEIDPCQVFNGGCDQICIFAHVNQAVCSCETGYHLRRDRVSCDPDECYLGQHSCHPNAHCTNTPEGYECSCEDGYLGDGFTCVAPTTRPQGLVGVPDVAIIIPHQTSPPTSSPPDNKDAVSIATTTSSSSSSSPPQTTSSTPTSISASTAPSSTVAVEIADNSTSNNMTFLLYPPRSTLTPPTVRLTSTPPPTLGSGVDGGHLGEGGQGGHATRRPGHFGVCPLPYKYYCLNGGECTYLKALKKPSCECQIGFAGERCQFTDKRITKGINMKTVTAVSAGVLAPLFLVLVVTAMLCYWRRARSKARSQAYNIEFSMGPGSPPDQGSSLPKKPNLQATIERLDKNQSPINHSVSQTSTQSMPPTRSPPKPPVASNLQNCYSDPNAVAMLNGSLIGAPPGHHYYKIPRHGVPSPRPKPSSKPNNVQLSASRSKFPLMNKISRTWDTAYLTPKDVITDLPSEGDSNRVSAFIDVQDTKSFLPTKPFLNIKNKLSKRIENVYVNMPKASTRINTK